MIKSFWEGFCLVFYDVVSWWFWWLLPTVFVEVWGEGGGPSLVVVECFEGLGL